MVDKPAGLLVHPSKPNGKPTLLDGLRQLLCYEIVNGGDVGIVNRLDRETSGIVLISKSSTVSRDLTFSMASRQVRKEYLALCFGWPEVDHFTVELPIRRLGEVRHSRVWLQRCVDEGGKPARTEITVLKRFLRHDGEPFSLVQARPFTGRTHQIRVHLAHAQYPVIGDKLYARGENWYLQFVEAGWSAEMETALWLSRQALHSARLTFEFRGKTFDFHCPLPAYLDNLILNSQEKK